MPLSTKKRIFFSSMALLSIGFVNQTQAQGAWDVSGTAAQTTTIHNTGIGIASPTSNLHIHGSTSYSGPIGGGKHDENNPSAIIYGMSSRIHMTNSTLPTTMYRGFEIRQSLFDAFITNLEDRGNINISAVDVPIMQFNSMHKQILVGGSFIPGSLGTAALGTFNISSSSNNGLYIRTASAGLYGMSVKVHKDDDIAYQSFGSDETKPNFVVTGDGFVFARRYTTTLGPIPDYVFSPNYRLMSFGDLRSYLNTNRHLPNVPSATEMQAKPVDLGELTRLLLEKIEENTLYILQLEERLRQLEAEK